MTTEDQAKRSQRYEAEQSCAESIVLRLRFGPKNRRQLHILHFCCDKKKEKEVLKDTISAKIQYIVTILTHYNLDSLEPRPFLFSYSAAFTSRECLVF